MDNAIEKPVEQKIHEAICYRMVSYIGSTEMTHQWGFLPDSLGYNEAKKIFAKRYNLMRFEDFYDDLIVAYMNNVVTKDKHKLTMGKVLEMDEIDEQRRPLYKKTNEQYKEFIEKIRLSSMDEKILVFQNEIDNSINLIDEVWGQLIKYVQNNITFSKNETDIKMPSWTVEEMNAVVRGISMIQQIGQETLEDELEQGFLEENIRERIQYIKDVTFEQGKLSNIDAEKIRLLFDERLNTLDPKKQEEHRKGRTKETLLEKILDGSVGTVTGNRFKDEFAQVQEFYEMISNHTEDLGRIINFYNIEQELNIGIYAIVAYELAVYGDIPKKEQKALVEKVAELALMDNCLSRQRQTYCVEKVTEEIEMWDKEECVFKTRHETYEDRGIGMTLLVSDICQEHLEGGERLWEKYKKEMRQLLKLKYTILNSMPQDYGYTDKVYDYLGTNTKESAKQHLNQIYEIKHKRIFAYLKMLLEENNRVVQERTACILKMK